MSSAESIDRSTGPPARPLRPIRLPDDVDDGVEKATGIVELPVRVRWSHPRRRYDLDDRRQRALVYEQVLQEGTDEDVRHFIDVDALIDLWGELYLPQHVRQRWAEWLSEHRGLDLPC